MKTGHIVDCFKTELKTFSRKYYMGALIVILLIPVILLLSSFPENGHYLYEDFNNSMAMLVVYGRLCFPILFSLYACSEYRSMVNRHRNDCLPRDRAFTKIAVCAGGLFASLTVYSLFCYIVSYFSGESLPGMFEKNISCFLAAYFILLFYSVFGMLISFLSRSSITSVIVTVVVYYLRLPFKLSPYLVFSNVLSKVFYSNSDGSFPFLMSEECDLSVSLSVVILMVYFVLMLTAVFLTGKIRKNRNKTNI